MYMTGFADEAAVKLEDQIKAVKTLGFIPAVFATADRILRDSKLGTATVKLDPSDPFIHEGPEAYLPEKRRERK